MSKDLLSEAIADAKAIREVALENAKASIAEAFAPQIKSMLSTRLQEEQDLEDDDLEEGFMFEEEDEDMMKEGDDEDMEMEEGFMFEEEDEDMMKEGDDEDMEMEEGFMFEEEDEDMMEGEEEEDLNLEAIIAELEEEAGSEDEEEMVDEAKGEEEDLTRESIEAYINELLSEAEDEEIEEAKGSDDEDVEDLKEELEEAYKTVKFLKSKINEVTLLNSKLLYSGRIFRNHTLNERQKVSILESFDRATTVRETKLLYTSISSAFKDTKNKKKVSGKKSHLKESRASKSTGSTKSTKVLQENRMVSRLQQLAGII